MPQVYNKHHRNAPPGAVYIGRGSPYGNPFVIGRDGDRAEVIRRFECEVLPSLDVTALRGQDVVCFCAPLPCHGDAIVSKANGEEHPMGYSDATNAIIACLHKTAFANGLNDGDGGPLADAIAIALQNGGFNEGEIIALFERE